uniref:Uncharacterized protein n=1 Tax=Anguilla anguilla TaxID=7936 RepID=A0A0E9S9T0_ANGAN
MCCKKDTSSLTELKSPEMCFLFLYSIYLFIIDDKDMLYQ